MSKRRNVGFMKPPEPSFITRMKEQIGYKEGPNVDTKRESLAAPTDEDLADRGDDEAPTVVVLREGDLSAEEAAREMALADPPEKETSEEAHGGRIVFRKPVKRDATGESISGSSSSSGKESRSTKDRKRPKQNKKLLSFQDDDEEEQD